MCSAPGPTPEGAPPPPPADLAWASPWELSDGASLLPGGGVAALAAAPGSAENGSQLTFQTARSNFGDSEGEEGGGGGSDGGSVLEALFPPAGAVRLPRQGLPRSEGRDGGAGEPLPSWGELERQLRGGAWPVPRLAPKARIQQQLQRARDPAWQELNSPGPWAGLETPAPAPSRSAR